MASRFVTRAGLGLAAAAVAIAGLAFARLPGLRPATSQPPISAEEAESTGTGPVVTRHGLRVRPARQGTPSPGIGTEATRTLARKPVEALDETLAQIRSHYGTRTARVVAMQLEYPDGIAQ